MKCKSVDEIVNCYKTLWGKKFLKSSEITHKYTLKSKLLNSWIFTQYKCVRGYTRRHAQGTT